MIDRMQQILFHTEPPHQPVLKSSSINMSRYNIYQKFFSGPSVSSQHVRGSKVLTTLWESKMPASSEYHTENTPSNLGQLILQCLFVQGFNYILNSYRPEKSAWRQIPCTGWSFHGASR